MNRYFLLIILLIASSMPAAAQSTLDQSKKTIYTLESIVVTAEKLSEYMKNHPQRVVVLNRQEIRERNFLETGEALDSMPGVDVKQSGSGTGYRISIRGSGGSGRVLVLVNGRPVISGQYGSADLDSIPIEIVEKVAVFKPPVPVWLGPGATAGAVYIVTGSLPETDSKEEKKIKHRLKISAGSYGKADMNYSSATFQDNGSIMITAGGTHRDGKRINSDKDTGRFSFHWDKTNYNLTQYDLNARYYHSYHGSSGPTDNPTPDARQRYEKGAFDLRADGIMGETGEFSIKSYADMENLEDRSQTGNNSRLKVYKIGFKGDCNWAQEDEKWALRLGGIIEQDSIDHDISGDHHREKASLHTQYDQNFNDFTFSLGFRGDYTNDFDFFPAFSTGLSYVMGKNSLLKSNAGYSVNVPTHSQLYQPSHGSIDQVRGNPYLSEEKIYSYDLGIEHKFGRDVSFETALFRTDTRDLIMYQRGADLIYRPGNIDHAYRQGVELSLKLNLKSNIFLNLNYIQQKSENRETGDELTYTPRHKGKINCKFTFKTDTKLEAIFRMVSRQYSDPENSDSGKLKAYSWVDLKVVQPVFIKSLPADIFVNLKNLLDTDFETHHGYPNDGFRFICGLNLNF